MTFTLFLACIATQPPVVAERPAPKARAAAKVLIKSARTIQGLHRGMRAGMFQPAMAHRQIRAEIKMLLKDKSIKAFSVDGSISDQSKARRIYNWLLNRPPKPKEQAMVVKHARKSKNRHTAYADVIWAIINTREFLYGASKKPKTKRR